MKLQKSIFEVRPDFVVNEGEQVCVNFDTEECSVSAHNGMNEERGAVQTAFKAYAVRVAHPVTRDRVIDAIVTAAYPADVMQAIINNHIMESESDEHAADFAAMQQWRAHAKEVATDVVDFMQTR